MDDKGRMRKASRRWGRLLTMSLFLAGVGGVAMWAVRFDVTPAGLRRMGTAPGWLIPATLCLTLPFLVHAVRYKLMLDRVVRVSSRFVLDMVLACSFFNHFVVAKIGDFAEPVWIQQHSGLDYWTGLRVGLLRALHSAVALGILAGVTLCAWAGYEGKAGMRAGLHATGLLLAGGTLAGFLVVVAWIRHITRLSKRAGPSPSTSRESPGVSRAGRGPILFQWAAAGLASVRRGVHDVVASAADYTVLSHLLFVLLAVVEVSLDALPYLFFALAAGVTLGPAPVLTASGTLNLIEYVPTPPALLGVQAWAATLSMLPASVPPETLAIAVFVHRTARTLVIGLIGAWPAWRMLRLHGDGAGKLEALPQGPSLGKPPGVS